MNTKKIIVYVVKIFLTCAAFAAAIYLLYRFEYIREFRSIDNILGVIPVSLIVICAGCASALVWMDYGRKKIPLAICLAAVFTFTAALFPVALTGNWFFGKAEVTAGSDGDISGYEPFKEGSLAAKLGEEPTLVLENDLPVMDGALALYPVYAAVAGAVYKKEAYTPDCVRFTNTLKAFDGIIAGERDVIFTAAASQNQLKAAKERGVELKLTPIGKEAFVFVVGKNNPVESITLRQIRNVYSGKTAKWATLGWKEGGDIIAFQRPEGSGSQTGLQQLMKGLPIAAPRPLPSKELIGTNSLMQQISVEWKGVQPALGYTYKFFGTVMNPNENAKFLKIDGVEPSVENIKSGAYPFTVNFYAVTRGEPAGNTKLLIDWLLSPQGQRLIEKTGYSPV